MNRRVFTIVLLLGIVFTSLSLVPRVAAVRLPGNNQNFEPPQPIAFSHRLHAGELSIPCLYCHFGAEKSRHAGIPAASVCMNCHRYVTATRASVRAEEALAKKEGRKPRRVISRELGKIYNAMGLDLRTMRRDPNRQQTPIAWARIHKLPDFAYFDHRAHVNAKVTCQTCHGPVETMERVRQVETLTMGWCVNCHRGRTATLVAGKIPNAPSDCSTCHY